MTTSPEHIEHMEKMTNGLMKACEEAGSMAREQIDAAMLSAAAMTKGIEEIARNANGLIQESMARSVSAGKTLMGAKTMQEMMDMQNEFMKDCFDCWMAGTSKISEISARMTQDVMKPIADHTNSAINKAMQKARAA